MRISRWCYLAAAAALAAALVAPATASALLTNEWNQQFAGTAVCVSCHGSDYARTTHGQFAESGADLLPSTASGMWPVGITGHGLSIDSSGVIGLGAGTGLREYLKFGAGTNGPFGVLTPTWDPASPLDWEIDGTTGATIGDYSCNQCHQVGAVKKGVKPPAVGNFASGGAFLDVTGTANTWALPAGSDPAVFASYLPGAGIQCERCHGTGIAATDPSPSGGEHWSSGVKIVGFNTATMKSTAKAFSTGILDAQVCGQCHGTFKAGGNVAGYTPDQALKGFVPNLYTFTDVPTEASFSANPAGYAFFPSGQNRSNKHSYYGEWALSGHSVRGAITATDTRALPYQAAGKSHYSSAGSARILCNRCHTGEGYLKRKGITIMSGWTEGTDTAGNYGQECVVCHISHGSVGATNTADAVNTNEAVGMSVRAPEQANGQYSTHGLNVANTSICEDCHNWQVEVLSNNGTVNSTPALPAILGKYVSHPQREVYHGRAMLEVPAGTDFMPGAKCFECHMPSTKSDLSGAADGYPESPADAAATGLGRYVDRNAKRYSHRMFIMMPGDAKAWGLAPWGDSCSPCHAGETQDALQANIDNWQSTATGLANNASSSIAAAVSAGHATAAGDVDLLKRASANLSLFVQDSSGGVHNPTYEQAGLSKAVVLAQSAGGTISISAPASVVSGALFGIQGVVRNGDGSPAAGVTITLWSGPQLGTAVTDANGNYAFAWSQTVAKTYTVLWERSSQTVSDLTNAVTVNMAAAANKTETDLTLTLSKQTRHPGQTFTVSGNITPAFAGASIIIQAQKPGSSTWLTQPMSPLTTNSAGHYQANTHLSTRGTWTYRARFAGNTTYLASTATHKITIN
jgi:mono/diheme cytochrome c family protein